MSSVERLLLLSFLFHESYIQSTVLSINQSIKIYFPSSVKELQYNKCCSTWKATRKALRSLKLVVCLATPFTVAYSTVTELVPVQTCVVQLNTGPEIYLPRLWWLRMPEANCIVCDLLERLLNICHTLVICRSQMTNSAVPYVNYRILWDCRHDRSLGENLYIYYILLSLFVQYLLPVTGLALISHLLNECDDDVMMQIWSSSVSLVLSLKWCFC